LTSEDALKRTENACCAIAKKLPVVPDSEIEAANNPEIEAVTDYGMGSERYERLLTEAVGKQFSDGCAASMEHVVHWVLMDHCGAKYRAAFSPNGDDGSCVYIPEGVKIARKDIRAAVLKYEETIIGRM